MNIDELMREVTSAETAGEIDGAVALLTRALVACKDGLLRAHLHEALANHFGRRCLFRKMNEHEDASAVAFGRLPGGSGIAEAHARYRDAIDAFGSRDDERGLALLRPAVATLRSRLGEIHPYARQVTNTLAGRSRDPADRVSLRAALLASSRVVHGDNHVNTLRALVGLGHALTAADRTAEATSTFERAFDALTGPRSAIEGAMGLRIAGEAAADAYQVLARLHGATGSWSRLAPREERLAKFYPRAAWSIRQVRLGRSPRVQRARGGAHDRPVSAIGGRRACNDDRQCKDRHGNT